MRGRAERLTNRLRAQYVILSCTGIPGSILAGWLVELRWLGRDELYDVDWLPGDYPILSAVADRMTPVRSVPGSGA